MSKLKSAFASQKFTAKCRNIQWNLTFEQWLDIWQHSGKLHLRGRGKNKYCICRFYDKGPYEVGNVYIDTFTSNNKQQNIWNPKLDRQFKNTLVTVKNPLGQLETYPNLSTMSRNLGFKYCTLWKNFHEKGSYKGYEKV